MVWVVINKEQIPDDLEPGAYCCRLDEVTLTEFRVRFVVPPRIHEPGDCLAQITKTPA